MSKAASPRRLPMPTGNAPEPGYRTSIRKYSEPGLLFQYAVHDGLKEATRILKIKDDDIHCPDYLEEKVLPLFVHYLKEVSKALRNLVKHTNIHCHRRTVNNCCFYIDDVIKAALREHINILTLQPIY